MTKVTIMLACTAGMSTSLVTKIRKLQPMKKLDAEILQFQHQK